MRSRRLVPRSVLMVVDGMIVLKLGRAGQKRRGRNLRKENMI